jgi:hypothetical protein
MQTWPFSKMINLDCENTMYTGTLTRSTVIRTRVASVMMLFSWMSGKSRLAVPALISDPQCDLTV